MKGRKNWKEQPLSKDYSIGKSLKSRDMDKREILLNKTGKKVGELHKGQPEYKYNKDKTKTATGRKYPDHYHLDGSKIHYIP